MNYIIIAFRFLFAQKYKILLFLFLSFVFLFTLFPFSDLNDYISSQISELTNKTVFVQFEEMHLNPFTTSIHLEKVFIETQQIENLIIEKLSAAPSIIDLIKREPGGHLTAEGIFKGNIDVVIKSLGKTEAGAQKSNINLTVDKISLRELKNSMNLPIPLAGHLNLKSDLTADLGFVEQPEGNVTLEIEKFEMPSSSVNLPDMGSINLPELNLKKVSLKGRLNNGKFLIESGKLGEASDDFTGTVKGEIGLTLQNMGGHIIPQVGTYKLDLDLIAKPSFKDRAQFFLNFIDGYKTEESNQTRYKFTLESFAPGAPPQFKKLD